ncbi:uncharacterized protein PFL1_06940 [Pseudozyma flocculosa PF-1]|uniref:uncharacterized protein n=1 Tax=Pseudozyma flocculosa PF-1 TaxID=1277687 RepID=UPI00045610FE|nr:uncharacterized protein PFL1_06940 [Pseudozyma flocculosa PF-1]EPQ30045.1 hypothetical protein PFL1_06940 [Pseudozyma flocculosa PF-1]
MDANLLSAGCKQHRAIANFFHATQPRRQVRTCRTYHSHLLIAPLLQETQLAESRKSPFSASQRAEADCARILALQAEVEQLRQAQTPPTAPSELPVAFAQLRQDLHAQLRGDFVRLAVSLPGVVAASPPTPLTAPPSPPALAPTAGESGTFHKPLFPWISADLYADTHPAHDLLHLADAAWTVDAAPEATTVRFNGLAITTQTQSNAIRALSRKEGRGAALLKFRDHLADLDATFSWDSVSDNTLRVCCARYTVAPAAVWAHLDHELYVPRLSGVLGKAQPTAPPPDPSFSLSKRKQHPAPASSSPKDNVCWNWHSGRCQADPCERKHVCHHAASAALPAPFHSPARPLLTTPGATTSSEVPPAVPSHHHSWPPGTAKRGGATSSPTPSAAPSGSQGNRPTPSRRSHLSPLDLPPVERGVPALLAGRISIPWPRPNTTVPDSLFHPADRTTGVGFTQLAVERRSSLLADYPDRRTADAVLGAIQHSIRLGYAGLPEGEAWSTKLRIIHHLSHLRAPGSGLPSVNPGVARSSTAIQDVTLAAVLDYVAANLGCRLWEGDAARLLGRMLDVHFFAETVLTFGGKSSPLLFDLFAEMPHWIMASFTPHPVEHDLDDLFGAVSPGWNAAAPVRALAMACHALDLALPLAKTFWGSTRLGIFGIGVDTVRQTVAITDDRRDSILASVAFLLDRRYASPLDGQRVAALLQLVTQVIPHGLAFLRRIYTAANRGLCCSRRCRSIHPTSQHHHRQRRPARQHRPTAIDAFVPELSSTSSTLLRRRHANGSAAAASATRSLPTSTAAQPRLLPNPDQRPSNSHARPCPCPRAASMLACHDLLTPPAIAPLLPCPQVA